MRIEYENPIERHGLTKTLESPFAKTAAKKLWRVRRKTLDLQTYTTCHSVQLNEAVRLSYTAHWAMEMVSSLHVMTGQMAQAKRTNERGRCLRPSPHNWFELRWKMLILRRRWSARSSHWFSSNNSPERFISVSNRDSELELRPSVCK